MVLENVKEMWTEKPKGSKGKGVNKDRFISKMYVLDVGNCALLQPYPLLLFVEYRLIIYSGSSVVTLSFSSCSAEHLPSSHILCTYFSPRVAFSVPSDLPWYLGISSSGSVDLSTTALESVFPM